MLPIVLIRKRKTEIKVTPWIVLIYTHINPVTKHLFISFVAIANIALYLIYIGNQYRWERLTPSRIMLSSFIHGDHHAF